MESIRVQVEMFNKSYLEVSEWLERAESFQSEQESIEMNLRSIRVLIKQQKVCSHVFRKYSFFLPPFTSFNFFYSSFLQSCAAFSFQVLPFAFQSCLSLSNPALLLPCLLIVSSIFHFVLLFLFSSTQFCSCMCLFYS